MSAEIIERDGKWIVRTDDGDREVDGREAAKALAPDAPVVHERTAQIVIDAAMSGGKPDGNL